MLNVMTNSPECWWVFYQLSAKPMPGQRPPVAPQRQESDTWVSGHMELSLHKTYTQMKWLSRILTQVGLLGAGYLTHTEAHCKLQHNRDGLWGQSFTVGHPLHKHHVVLKFIVSPHRRSCFNCRKEAKLHICIKMTTTIARMEPGDSRWYVPQYFSYMPQKIHMQSVTICYHWLPVQANVYVSSVLG